MPGKDALPDEGPPPDELSLIAEQARAPVSDQDAKTSHLIGRLFLFPLGIIVVGVAISLVVVLLTAEDQTAQDYLNTVRVGGANSRWQAAYTLSQMLVGGQDQGQTGPDFVREMVRVFEASRSDDPRVRRYLALAMGKVDDPATVPTLISALDDPDGATRIYAILSLGVQGDTSAVLPLIEMTSSGDGGTRKAAVYALGQLQDPRVRPALVAALKDRAPDVRWNAALQLGRMRNDAGMGILMEMLDREYLETLTQMSEDQRADVMIQAVHVVSLLDARSTAPTLQDLRERDPNMKVRQAAIDVLKAWEE